MSLLSWLRRKSPAPAAERPLPERYLSYQCAACQGIGSRERQEDSWTLIHAEDVTKIRKLGLLALVADGMGGMEGGELASQMAVQILSEEFHQMDRTQPLEQQLCQGVQRAAKAVCGQLQGRGGSTVIACMVYDQQLYFTGMGDSYLYLFRGGKLIRINREQNVLHKRYLELIRQGNMDISMAEDTYQAHAVTDFLGMAEDGEQDQFCRAMPLLDGDVLLLCSDGVGGVLLPSEICECLALPNVDNAAASLERKIQAKGLANQDNYTAVIIRCRK